jgi:hypothetical protein
MHSRTREALKVLLQAVAITGFSAALAIGTNLARADGIPLVTDIPYEIFAPCRDSEVKAEALGEGEIDLASSDDILYVDARPAEEFAKAHVKDAVNTPYSPLFGAGAEDVAEVKAARQKLGATAIVVYGLYAEPGSEGAPVDLAESLAEQLIEEGLTGVRHAPGGLAELNRSGVSVVRTNGADK